MAAFVDYSPSEQQRIARTIARRACDEFGLTGAAVKCVNAEFNTTFRVTSNEGRFALRLNINSRRRGPEIEGEVAWVEALANGGKVRVARPRRTVHGQGAALIEVPELAEAVPCAMFEWLSAPTVGFGTMNARLAAMVGSAMHGLHVAAIGQELPPGARRPVLHDVLDGLGWTHPEHELFTMTLDRANAALGKLAQQPARLIHFDVHMQNAKRDRDGLILIDFDDAVWGWPLVDVAQAMYYLRRNLQQPEFEQAYWDALQIGPSEGDFSEEDFELLVTARNLLMVASLATSNNHAWREALPGYMKLAEVRVKTYWDTGRYDPFVRPD